MFLQDLFDEASDTTLISHTPDLGGVWSKQTGYVNESRVWGGVGYASAIADSTSIYRNGATPPSADYYVEADIVTTVSSIGYGGVIARASATVNTFYQAYYTGDSGLELTRVVFGDSTSIGTYAMTWTANAQKTLRLEVEGTTIRVKLDGVQVISVTDNVITEAGHAGVRSRVSGRILEVRAGSLAGAVTHDASGSLSATSATVAGSSALTSATTTHEASGALSAGSATLSGTATYVAIHAASGTLQAGTATVSGTAARSAAGTATLSTPPLKNNTGTVLASLSGWTVNVYNVSTGALIVQKTGLSTDASGVLTITDAALTASTTYSYEPVHATYGRRLPVAVAA